MVSIGSRIGPVQAPWGVDRLRVRATDVATAALAIAYDASNFLVNAPGMIPDSWMPAGIYLFTGAWVLIWRHKAPLPVLAIIMVHVTLFVTLFFGGPLNPRGYEYGAYVPYATLLVALAAVAANVPIRRSIPVSLAAVLLLVLLQEDVPVMVNSSPWIIYSSVTGGVLAWSWGWITGRSRRRITALEEERQKALEAVETERAHIANELHDIVAHAVTVMMLHAAGGRRVIETDPIRAAQALDVIETVGTEATQELARLLGVLRPKDGSAADDGLGPFPGLGDVGQLISTVQSAGVNVSLVEQGEPRKLGISVGHAAYRVVQEALTNITKHAGPGTNATVTITWEQDSVGLVVSDDGAGQAPMTRSGKESGFGLLGLRERVAVAGGSVTWTSQDLGFVVDAKIPVTN
ncbi:histidine kinase [Arthrobacter sp. Cr_A7]|uniref:sensor histidine kinase n=1 Tax=Arthrobacter sp. Cr_A7 TaxID=3031017 RepID=UPI0023DBCD8F|nr:histidine kinase [Arthrobacter sp. Cr_A7]MDF2048892.1 histidine kinase [Arthrobacter sp. Cr_A7]